MSKTFDKVLSERLSYRLKSMGTSGPLLALLRVFFLKKESLVKWSDI